MAPDPPPAPTPEAVKPAAPKCKLAVLEAEHELAKAQPGSKVLKRSQVHIGRILCRVDDLFADPRDLVGHLTLWFRHVKLYAAIVDFFEATPGPRAQAKADKLLEWWNK
ncbi:hypothetical protein HWV62_14224 [Athelia sp. TMB]|nr:hypothetical protein HWV62_14224 [Athelia sp. TMB]